MSERVMVFIDGQNLRCSTPKVENWEGEEKDRPRKKVDYEELLKHFSNFGDVRRVYFFSGYDKNDSAQGKFLKFLQYCGIDTQLKTLVSRKTTCPHCEKEIYKLREKGVDVSLVTLLMHMGSSNSYDTAILVSGDSDFIPAIEFVKMMGKKVIIMTFEDATPGRVKRAVDKFQPLDAIADKICFEGKKEYKKKDESNSS